MLNVRDFGAVGNGVADDTRAVQAAINAASYQPSFLGERTGLSVHFPLGVYRTTSALVLPDNGGVSLVGEGKTKSNIFAANAGRGANAIHASGNNYRGAISGLRLTGPAGNLSAGAAIRINGSGNQIDVVDCWISTFRYGIAGTPHSDSNLLNNLVEYVAQPLVLAAANDITIAHNSFYNCGPIALGGGTFDPAFAFDGCRDVIVTANRFVTDAPCSHMTAVLRFRNCADCVLSSNVFWRGNTFDADALLLIEGTAAQTPCERVVVQGNNLGRSARHGIKTSGYAQDLVIGGNTFAGTQREGAYSPIALTGSAQVRRVTVTGNAVRQGAARYGIAADAMTDLVLTGNTVEAAIRVDPGVTRVSRTGNIVGTVVDP